MHKAMINNYYLRIHLDSLQHNRFISENKFYNKWNCNWKIIVPLENLTNIVWQWDRKHVLPFKIWISSYDRPSANTESVCAGV